MTSVADQPGPDASDAHRVSVLRAYGILDTPTNERFDAVVRLAARLCETPIAMIGLVDADRLWFKARYGDAIQEVPRSEAFSDHALSSGEDFIEVPDLRADERFCHHTAVTEGHSLYYAAVVLRTPDGIPLGTLAVSDAVPRQLTAYQIDALRSLARQVESLLDEHRSTSAPLPGPLASRAALLQGMAASGVATALLDGEGRYSWWSDECAERLGWTAVEVLGRRPQDFLYDEADEVGAGEPPLQLRVDHRWHGRRRILHADGSMLEVEGFALALRDADGEVEAYLTGMVDSELFPSSSSHVGLVESVLVRSEDAVLLCDGRLAGEGPTIAYANPAACALAGMRLVELVGLPAATLVDGHIDAERMAALVQALRAGQSVREELTVVTANGGRVVTEVELTPFGDVTGGVAQVVIVIHDITGRRTAEREAAATEARLRLAAELAGIGAWEMDLRSGEVMWDARVRELLNVAPDTPSSLDRWRHSLVEDDALAGQRRIASFHEGVDSVEAAYRVPCPDGSERRLLARGRVTERDEHGPSRMIGVLIDVTESHAAADRVVSTLESIAEGYFALDRKWCFTYINRRGEEMLGRPREELIGTRAEFEFPVGTLTSEQFVRAMAGESVEFERYLPQDDRWYEVRAYPLPDGIAVHYRDVSARLAQRAEREALLAAEREARAELAHAATHDPLTGLPNRVELLAWLTDALSRPRPSGAVAVLFCDVDRFKVVNDSLGHAAGDELLVAVARRLCIDVRPGDIVARLGGDEFVVALSSATLREAETVAARLLDSFREPVLVAGRRLVVSTSIGLALADADATAETLLRDADAALYLAKDHGRDQVARFDDELRTNVVTRLQTEHELRDAVSAGQMRLHYQPSFDLRTGRVAGAEALLRWEHPTRGLLAAGAFIELAEDTGLVGPLGDWVVPEACGARSVWGSELDDLVVWVNVSLRQLVRPGYARHLLDQIAAAGGSPDLVGIEVTESALAEDHRVPLRELRLLSGAGVRIAIDDFGTGYSSLSRLRRYPVDVLKLDRAFVADVHTRAGRAVVAAVVELAHALDAVALAEGVETAEQLEIITALGCDQASGWHLAYPVPAAELASAISAAPV